MLKVTSGWWNLRAQASSHKIFIKESDLYHTWRKKIFATWRDGHAFLSPTDKKNTFQTKWIPSEPEWQGPSKLLRANRNHPWNNASTAGTLQSLFLGKYFTFKQVRLGGLHSTLTRSRKYQTTPSCTLINPFTAPACKSSRLEDDACTCGHDIFQSYNLCFQWYAFW